MTQRHRILTLAAIVGIAVSSCSSADDGGPSPTDAATPGAVTTDEAAPPAVTDPPATDPPATDPPVTAPQATDPETTVPDSAAPTEPEPPAIMPASYDGYVSELYANDDVWLCRKGTGDAATGDGGDVGDICDRNLDATIVRADGSTEVVEHVPVQDAPIDCFYVYPTTSTDQSSNSDLVPGEAQEIRTTLNQFARLGSQCNLYAPVYRQVTIPALFDQVERADDAGDIAFGDVVDSFRHFIANDNDGRPFVLVGHSQGAGILGRLIDAEIDGESSLRDRMVSAILLGTSIAPDRYENLSACASNTDTHCIVSYSSYADDAPPFDGAYFGSTDAGPAMCVNPVDPAAEAGAGSVVAQPYFSLESGATPFDDPARSSEITTTYVTYPDMVAVRCVDDGTFAYLELTVVTEPGDRTDILGGDLTPEWGKHLIDANVAMGDLVDLVEAQAAAFG